VTSLSHPLDLPSSEDTDLLLTCYDSPNYSESLLKTLATGFRNQHHLYILFVLSRDYTPLKAVIDETRRFV